MLWKSEYPNHAKELFPTLNQMTMRLPLETIRTRILLWLTIVISTAFVFFSIEIPTSTGSAHAPEWTSSSTGLQYAGTIDLSRLNELEDLKVYLPLVVRNFPATPLPPELDQISNPDGDGNYTVSWTAVEGADTYLLHEDDNADFSNPTTVYEGTATSQTISGKVLGTYYYRVMAYNAYASSGWSNVEPVVVNATPPACPQTGSWQGLTDQGFSIEFIVEDSPVCQIAADSLTWGWKAPSCIPCLITFGSAFPIIDNSFSVTGRDASLNGDFTAPDEAFGIFIADYWHDTTHCYYWGVWNAFPVDGVDGPVYDLLVQPDD